MLNIDNIFIFFFIYINSVSIKLIFDLFKKLEEANKTCCDVRIEWKYNAGDTDMKETGEEYMKIIHLPFDLTVSDTH